MVGFEQVRIRALADAAREWRGTRFLPLYAAGIVAGVAVGIGLTHVGGSPATEDFVPAHLNVPLVSAPPAEIPQIPVDPWAIASDAPAPPEELPVAFLSTFAMPPVEVPPPAVAAPAPAQPQTSAPANSAPAQAPASAPESRPIETPPPPPAPQPANDFYIPSVVGGNPEAEARLLAGINAQRAANGLPAYTLDAGLTNIARIRSQQMVDQGYFGHTDPYGHHMYWELLNYFGYSYAWAGENLAMNNYGMDQSPERALDALMNSPTHRANILASDFYRIGIGEVTASDGRHFYTMIFLG
ncbi:MAG: CAP domain-containing protein [Hyphomicrobiales bacterium]